MKVYEYRGFVYQTYDDIEEDNIKTFHECWKDGKRIKMPREFDNHSPYSLVPFKTFKEIIDTNIEVWIHS